MAFDKAKTQKAAEKYVASGKIPQAIEEYLKILKESPKDWNLMIQIGDLFLRINKTDEAIPHFQKVADHYFADGFFLKAIAIYKRINKLDPSRTEICIRLADLYLKQGLSMDAKSQLTTVAQHYMSKNQIKEAIQTYKKLLEIEPDNLKTRNELAKAYKSEGMIAEAIKEYLEISDELTRKSLLKESLQVLETAYKLDPRNISILRKILSIYSDQHEVDRATTLLEETLRIDPGNPDVLSLLAESYASKNNYQKAHETIDRAIEATAEKEPLWLLKGEIHLKEGKLDQAFAQFSQVVERMVRRKEAEKGVVLMQKVTRADASYTPALQKLIELYSALHQETNVLATYSSLVDAFISRQKYQDAAGILDRLIQLEPDNAQHQEKLEFVRSLLAPKPAVEITKSGVVPTVVPPKPAAGASTTTASRPAAAARQPSGAPAAPPAAPPSRQQAPAPPVVKTPPVAPPTAAKQPLPSSASSWLDAPTAVEPEAMDELSSGDLDLGISLQIPIETPAPPTAARKQQPVVPSAPPTPAKGTPAGKLMPKAPAPPVAATPVEAPSDEEKEFVSEHLIEAEVFTKYGLIDKAIEQLQMVVSKYPTSVLAHQKLREIYEEKGDRDKAVEECITMSRIFRKQGDSDQAEDLLSEARQIQPNHPALDKAYREMPATAAPATADVMGEIEKLAQSMKSSRPSASREKPAPPQPKPVPAGIGGPTRSGGIQVVQPPPPPAPVQEIEIDMDEAISQPSGELDVPAPGAFEEIDFYADQGLISEARKLLDELRTNFPNDPGVLSRLEKLGGGGGGAKAAAPAPAAAAVSEVPEADIEIEMPDNGSESEGMLDLQIDQSKEEVEAEEEKEEAPAEAPEEPAMEIDMDTAEEAAGDEAIEIEIEEPAAEGEARSEDGEELSVDVEAEEEKPQEPEVEVEQSESPSIEQTWDLASLSDLPGAAGTEEAPAKLEEVAEAEEEEEEEKEEEVPAEAAADAPEPGAEMLDLEQIAGDLEIPEEPSEAVAELPAEQQPMDLEVPEIELDTEPAADDAVKQQEAEPAIELEMPEIEEEEAEVTAAEEEAAEEEEKEKEEPAQEEPPAVEFVSPEPEPEAIEAAEAEFGELEMGEASGDQPVADQVEEQLSSEVDAAFDRVGQEEQEEQKDEGPTVAHQAPQELFHEEEDFFDLASELEDGLLGVQNAVEEEKPSDGHTYSLEEILTDFKKGVEKQLGSEDYDTRYNLGIAYKEMGLIDEAIGEFQIASKDEKRFLECCSMLGLCFLEKGMPKLAIKWYQKGLEVPGHSEEQYLGLRFDMAQALETMGEYAQALETYQEVYGLNANYRNVTKKISEVQENLKRK